MADKSLKRLPVRLAIRRQGQWVVAHLAKVGTMDDAIELGRIAHNVIENNDARWEKWKAFWVEMLSEGIEEVTGEQPEMIEEKAPESERSGHA